MNLTTLSLAETRPIINLALVLLSVLTTGVTGYGMLKGWRSIHSARPAWRHSFRLSGWLSLVAVVLVILLVLLTSDSQPGTARGMEPLSRNRVIETVIPLALAAQAALLFAPDDDPAMELLLSCPRPAPVILIERYAVVLLGQTAVAAVAALTTLVMGVEEDLLLALLRWVPPALVLSGLALNAAIRSRRAVFGILSVGVIWFVVGFFRQAFLPGQPTFYPLNYLQPWLWSVHIYLQPGDMQAADYVTNRIFVLVIGIMLIALAVNYVRDSERLLLGKSALKLRRSMQ